MAQALGVVAYLVLYPRLSSSSLTRLTHRAMADTSARARALMTRAHAYVECVSSQGVALKSKPRLKHAVPYR